MVWYDGQVITNQVFLSGMVVWLMRVLKRSHWFPWINGQTPNINRAIAVIASGLVALNITWNYSYTDEGVFTLAITGLQLSNIFETIKMWIFSYMVQQTGFRMTEKVKE